MKKSKSNKPENATDNLSKKQIIQNALMEYLKSLNRTTEIVQRIGARLSVLGATENDVKFCTDFITETKADIGTVKRLAAEHGICLD